MVLFILSCNSNLTDEERKELWSNAQTTGEIINRSGTSISSATMKKDALRDAENRLSTGGSLLGNNGMDVLFGGGDNEDSNRNGFASVGMPINPYLWSATLETLNFIPLSSADPIGGTILTDWYSSEINENERCKVNVFISGAELKTQNLRVTTFCEIFKNNKWLGVKTNVQDNIDLENAILNKAKKLKLKNT